MTTTPEEINLESPPNEDHAKQEANNYDRSIHDPDQKPHRLWLSRRLLITVLLLGGYFVSAIMRVYISIAVIEMTTNTTIHIDDKTIHRPAEFHWNTKIISVVLSAQSYGFWFSAVGGRLATYFGGSVMFGWATALGSALTILNPAILQWDFYAFLICRVLTGLCDGFAYASTAEVVSFWVPTKERSTLMAIVFSGVYIAVAVTHPVCGYLAYYWGWRTICYFSGSLSLTWSIVWLIIAKNQPSQDKYISKKELRYILRETDSESRKKIIYPYKEIFTSAPVWATCAAKFAYGWGFGLIVTYLPLYVKDITKKEVNEVGVISSIPNIVCIFMTPVAGAIMDYLQNNANLRPSQVHKIMMSVGFISSSVLFVIVAISVNFTISMMCFILIKLLLSFNFLILHLICLYLAPRYSGIMLGMTGFWFMTSGIVMPSIVGFLTENHTMQEWGLCFLLTAGILLLCGIVHFIYGSSELQPWATSSCDSNKEPDTKE